MRKIVRISGFTLGAILTVLIAYVGLFLYPDIFFTYHFEYRNFTVHSDQQYGDELVIVIRDIEEALATSEIYDPNLKHDIYFGYGKEVFKAIQKVSLNGPANTYNRCWPPYLSQSITFGKPDLQANTIGVANLRQLLTHEVVHALLDSKLGLRSAFRYPMWKTEGYCDYVAASTSTFADPSYDIRMSVERILRQDLSWMKEEHGNFIQMRRSHKRLSVIRNEQGIWWPTGYYISRVLWEYLHDVKGLTFDEAMRPEVTDIDTLTELIAAYESGSLG